MDISKMNRQSAFLPFFSALAAVAAVGCAATGTVHDFVAPPSNLNAAAWAPRLPEASQVPESGSSRPLRKDDKVNVVLHTRTGATGGGTTDVIDEAGIITLPLVGDIKVGGLTASEAEKKIRDAYIDGGFYRSIDVTVVSPDVVQQQVYYVNGATRKTGSMPWTDGLTLRRAIIQAGDVNDFASGKIEITRNGVKTVYDLDRIARGRDEDPVVLPGDILTARERWL